MRSRPWMFLAGATALLVGPLHLARGDAVVTINADVKHQTVHGWGASSWLPPQITPALRQELIEATVNELGLTRLRLEPPGGNAAHQRRWEWENDNADPYDIDWTALNTPDMAARVNEMVAPFKQKVEANGDPFTMYLSPSFFTGGSTGEVPPWLFHCPAEYAEFATSMLRYLKEVHQLDVDYYCILNEAGNNNPFWEDAVARMIKALGPRLTENGLSTRIQFPEAISADTSWSFIRALQNDSAIWPYIGMLSYHLYGSNDPARSRIRDFGLARGLPTAQTEYMSLTMDVLYADFINGGVSVWEIYGLTSQFDPGYERLRRKGYYWRFRQVMRYVRPGAVRISATSSDAGLRVLAFRKDTTDTIVLINGAGVRRTAVGPLPQGVYAVSHAVGTAACQSLGLQTTDAAGTLVIDVPSEAVLTIQTYEGTNLPPVPTQWESVPEYLAAPGSGVTLSAAATDPELDPIACVWSVTTQPDGANVVLATPNAPSTNATGLTIPGTYVFTAQISDASHTVNRQVRVPVFTGNQPPVPGDVHNRNPVLVTLPQSSTTLRAGGWDLEGDALTYAWEVVSQPAGANALLATPNTASCVVSDLSRPGSYVFRVGVSDGTHTSYETLTVPVYPLNSAPAITGITATPRTLALPGTSGVTQLEADVSDAEGDIVSYWWSVVSNPSGTKPLLATPAGRATEVQGLTNAGTYVFRLTAVDRSAVSTADVSVSVRNVPGDMDLDLDVDLEDFGLFQACFSGVNVSQTLASCFRARLDGDTDVDDADAEVFLGCLSGPNRPANPECDR